MFCYAIVTSRNVREVIDRAIEFAAMLQSKPDVPRVRLTVIGEVATFHMHTNRLNETLSGAIVDLAGLANFYRTLSWMVGEPLPLVEGHLSHGEQFSRDIPQSFLPFTVQYKASSTKLCFPAKYLNARVLCTYDDFREKIDLYPYDLPWYDTSPRPLTRQITAAFQTCVLDNLNLPDLEELAEMFGLSPVTLHRRLLEEETSVSQLKETWRRAAAEQLVSQTSLTLEEIGYRLRYSDAANFSRAFKRWFGVSPDKFRKLQ